MSKAILEFDLSNMDDVNDYKRLSQNDNLSSFTFEIARNLKKKLFYKIENQNLDKHETLNLIFEEILELIEDKNINVELL